MERDIYNQYLVCPNVCDCVCVYVGLFNIIVKQCGSKGLFTRNTRLQSSRMRTARVLTVSHSMLCTGGCTWSRGGLTWSRRGCTRSWGGVYLVPGDVPGTRGCTWSWGVYLVLGGVPGPGGCVPGPGSVPGSRGVYLVPGGCRVLPPCEQNDKLVQKYYLVQNFVCGR